ncbi:MAG: thioredoxin family protein, partial [Kiritimatiellia bacterium]
MKTRLAAIAATLTLTAAAYAAPEGWLTDFEQAQAQAKETGRPILVNFSGSDWCGWCIRLDNEVLKEEAFKAYAKDNLVLFVADFPRRTKLPEKLAKQNETLAQRYSIQGFPTVLLLDAKGDVIGRTGYRAGGPEAYIAHLR